MSNFDRKNQNNKPRATKPVVKTLPIVLTGKDQKGNDYDTASCLNIINSLNESGCFDKISIQATIGRNRIVPDAKGVTNVGRILSINEDGYIELLLIGKNVGYADLIDNMVIIPRILKERNSTKVSTILGFEIVPAMEA